MSHEKPRPTQLRRRTVTEAERIIWPEPGAGLRRVTITNAAGAAPQVAIALFPYRAMPGDDPTTDDAGSLQRMDNPPSANAVGAQTGSGALVEPGSDNDYGRAGRSYLMPVFESGLLDLCMVITEEQWVEAMAVNTGYAILAVTVEYI